MIVKTIDAPACHGGKALALCDDDGNPVAQQVCAIVRSHVGELPTVTVEFYIDGETIRFAD